MPSSKLCPVCNTADLMGSTDGQPNHNTCTQCRSMVCNQCGFNPNPHLTQVGLSTSSPLPPPPPPLSPHLTQVGLSTSSPLPPLPLPLSLPTSHR
jgi:hypothetical protein